MDPGILALGNLIFQTLLFALFLYSGYVARVKKDLVRHCTIMRIGVLLLIVSTVLVMAPSMLGYVRPVVRFNWFIAEMFTHAALGLVLFGLWVFVNLAQTGRIKLRHRLLPYMKTAAILWVLVFVIGVHMYFVVWG